MAFCRKARGLRAIRRDGRGRSVSRSIHALSLSLADFNRMVDDHGPALFRIAYRMVGDRQDAEDLTQEAFHSAWKSRDLFQPGGSERAWLVSILRRRITDHWRRPKPPILSAGDGPLAAGILDDPTRHAFREELSDDMQQALRELSHDLRETLLLVVVAELTHQEAADLLGIPLGTVLSRVSRARRQLRKHLSAKLNKSET